MRNSLTKVVEIYANSSKKKVVEAYAHLSKNQSTIKKTDARVKCFNKLRNALSEEEVYELCDDSWEEDKLETLRIIAYCIDNCNHFEKQKLMTTLLGWLAEKSPRDFELNLEVFAKIYGNFDSIISLIGTPCEESALRILSKQLQEDIHNYELEKPFSLAARRILRERKTTRKQLETCEKLANFMNLSPEQLISKYLAPLRKHLKFIETTMYSKGWQGEDFSQVVYARLKEYGKYGNEFEKLAEESYKNWKFTELTRQSTKAVPLLPHQILDRYYSHEYYSVNAIVESQWSTTLESFRRTAASSSTVIMPDVSVSMMGKPMVISLTLGLLFSEIATDEFQHVVLTFESNPRLYKIRGETLYERMQHLDQAAAGGCTDFHAAMRLILDMAKKHKSDRRKVPQRLIVVSDMPFKQVDLNQNFENCYKQLELEFFEAGYRMPQLVFWNVAKKSKRPSIELRLHNHLALISGFSLGLLQGMMNGEEITPYSSMHFALSDRRYDLIQQYKARRINSIHGIDKEMGKFLNNLIKKYDGR